MSVRDPNALLEGAIKAGEARDYAGAIEALTTLLAGEDAPIEALLFLGRSYYALGEGEKAIVAFRAFLRSGGDGAAGNFFLGRAYLGQGRSAEASQCLRRSLQIDPDRAQAWALLGAAQLKLKRSKLALSCLERATSLAPEDGRIFHGYLNALFIRSCKLLGRGDFDMARQMLGFVIENGLDGPGPRLWRARSLRELGRHAEALMDCEQAIRWQPEDPSLKWLRAGLLLSSGRQEEALAEFEKLRINYPQLPGIPRDELALGRLRASVAFRDERWKEAISESLALLRHGPDNPALRAIAAESYRALGQLDKARSHWERAIEQDPNAAEFRLGLALVLFELGNFQAALAASERARKLGADDEEVEYYAVLSASRAGDASPALQRRLQALLRKRGADPRLMFALGESLYRSGRPDLAAGWFEKVLSLVPDHELSLLYRISVAESLVDDKALAPAHEAYLEAYPDNNVIRREYVDILFRSEAWSDAAKAIEAGLAYCDDGGKTRRRLALAYRNAGRFREAALIYRDLLRASPDSQEILLALAYCLERNGQGDYALALLEKAPAVTKKGASPWIVMGLLYEKRGRKEAAVDAFRRATELEPGNARAWRDLGLLYHRMGLADFSFNCLERAKALGAKIEALETPAPSPRASARSMSDLARAPAPLADKAKAPDKASKAGEKRATKA